MEKESWGLDWGAVLEARQTQSSKTQGRHVSLVLMWVAMVSHPHQKNQSSKAKL